MSVQLREAVEDVALFKMTSALMVHYDEDEGLIHLI